MFGKTKIFWLTLLLGVILLAGWWFLSNDQKITLAIGPAPTVALSGDDYNLTGGTDDPYDSFLLIRPQSNQNYFLDYLLDYSADSGRHWQLVPAETRIINGAIPNPTPVLYWDFEEGNGTTIHNRVGSDTATVNGSFAWQQSFFNQAVNFTGGFLSPLSANLVNSSAGTISFWLYPANLTNQQYIFRYCTDGACNSNNRLYFRLEPDGTAAFGISNVAVNLGMVMPNVWQHFAVSYSGGLFQIYKNGVQVQNGAFNAFVINNPMTIVPLIGGTAYNGYLDEVKIFSQGLNVGQVSDIYNGVNNLQNNLSYYWPLNSLGNQDLNLRVRVKTAQGISNASLQTIRLRHRFGSRGRNYFVENFLTQTWQGSGSPGWWNVASGSLQFSNQSVNCPGGVIRPISTDLLTGLAGKLVITKITWQAAQMVENNSSIAYEFSTDGVNWQPGLTANNTSVTNPQIITLAQPGTSLYWRASLTRGNSCAFVDQPKIYSIRLAWEYNHDPRACFKVSPTRSANPDQVFTFTSSCSADAEDAPAQLTYQWDFNQDGQIDNQGQTVTHSFGTTTPQTISLKVRDTFNASSTFSQSINPALFLGGKVNGWGWSPNWGWLSLNCENIYNGITAVLCKRNGQGRANYGLEIDDADYSLNGYAWSDSLGWVCFGKTCTSQGLTPDGSAAHLIISVTDGSLSGWAKVMSLGEEGWLRLDDPEHPAFNVRFNSSTQSLEGLAWGAAQDPANGIFYGLGPIDFNKSFTSYPWLETKYGNIYSLGGLG
ncbi:MAG: PKD domain-containing protein, partial [Candidatus Komeilibacteria bacterium]|nr:PKD domain-containing protein [Candidatus Komeilibacteria bacterium]